MPVFGAKREQRSKTMIKTRPSNGIAVQDFQKQEKSPIQDGYKLYHKKSNES